MESAKFCTVAHEDQGKVETKGCPNQAVRQCEKCHKWYCAAHAQTHMKGSRCLSC